MENALNNSLDELVYGNQNEKARISITDNELLKLFNKSQQLDDDLEKSVIDFFEALMLKQGLRKQLA